MTGATGGIGSALVAAFAAAGYRVVATDRHAPTQRPLAAAFVHADLVQLATDAAALASFGVAVEAALGGAGLAVLINNAAVQRLGGVDAGAPADLREGLEVNVVAALALTTRFADALAVAGGSVINIGSVHAGLTKPGFLAYSVSKAALAGLTRALALELAPRGVRVNEIRPGATRTAMLTAGFAGDAAGYAALAAHQPLGRLVEPAEVAELALFLASPRAACITGAAFAADGGIGARLHDPA